MDKLKLKIEDLAVQSYSVSDSDLEAADIASDVSCNMWCTLAGACVSWFVCSGIQFCLDA